MDGESRPSSAPDIGVDQFNDTDADDLADQWEISAAGDLTTLTGRSQDADSDGLTNEQEHALGTDPMVVDSDSDGLSDGDEFNVYHTSPSKTDSDGDDMPDGWEVEHGLSATVADGFDDLDGDRYPNIFEYARSSDPNDAESIPTPNYTVSATGGTHTTVSAAISASSVTNGAYQIIGIAPGVYTGSSNVDAVSVNTSKPKFLIIGLEGADKTIIDGEGTYYGWTVYNSTVIASLTFRKTQRALYLSAPSKDVRFVDLLIRDNVATTSYAGGVYVTMGYPANLKIVGSTFLNNTGGSFGEQIWLGEGTATIENTVVWGTSSGLMLGNRTGTTLTTNHCLVKGQTLSGTGNLAGTVDPKLRFDAHLRSDSPLRGAGASVSQSRVDIDGELRPSSAPDIGVDQFIDSDADELPDSWELAVFGDLTTLDGFGDEDSDGLDNSGEYDFETDCLEPDTDGDGIDDGLELSLGTNPRVVDSDDLSVDLNHDGVIDSIGFQLGHSLNEMDTDGDGVSNTDERLMCTDPLRSDTDGDGVSDNLDAFPHDPLTSTLPSDPEDTAPPVITLIRPWYAVEQ